MFCEKGKSVGTDLPQSSQTPHNKHLPFHHLWCGGVRPVAPRFETISKHGSRMLGCVWLSGMSRRPPLQFSLGGYVSVTSTGNCTHQIGILFFLRHAMCGWRRTHGPMPCNADGLGVCGFVCLLVPQTVLPDHPPRDLSPRDPPPPRDPPRPDPSPSDPPSVGTPPLDPLRWTLLRRTPLRRTFLRRTPLFFSLSLSLLLSKRAHQNSTRRPPERANMVAGEGKKARNFWLPTRWFPHLSGPVGPHPLGSTDPGNRTILTRTAPTQTTHNPDRLLSRPRPPRPQNHF